METNEIILILAKLAKSEELHVESSDNDTGEDQSWTPDWRGELPCLGRSGAVAQGYTPGFSHVRSCSGISGVAHVATSDFSRDSIPCSGRSRACFLYEEASAFSHATRSSSGTVWTAVSGLAWNAASRVWRYVTGNYGVAVHVQVLPVNDLLMRLRDPHRETLANRMREIMRQHSVVDLNGLADTIQQDSSLVRQIILKQLVDYLIDDLSLSVRMPAGHESLEYSSDA